MGSWEVDRSQLEDKECKEERKVRVISGPYGGNIQSSEFPFFMATEFPEKTYWWTPITELVVYSS